MHLSLASLEQQDNFILENMIRIEEEIQKFCNELEELGESRGNASEEIREKEEDPGITATIEESKELFEEIRQEIHGQTSKREELNQKNKDFLRLREDLSKHIADLDKETFRLKSQKEGI